MCDNCKEPNISGTIEVRNLPSSDISLDEDTLSFLSKTRFRCLCRACLLKIDREICSLSNLPLPCKREEFVGGLHYYEEDNVWVFTEKYHYLKGYCCKNNCRHCVYGIRVNREM